MTMRLTQIWLGQSIDPAKATAYRRRWVKRLADELGISQQKAYQLLCAEYGEPPEPMFAVQSAETSRRTVKVTIKTVKVKRREEFPDGPGTEYEKLAKQFNIQSNASCSCQSLKHEMNRLGVDGCREQRDELVAKLRKNYAMLSVWDKVKALFSGGIPAWLNPLDPVGSMFDEAVRRAENR